jgi:hypothetical protein
VFGKGELRIFVPMREKAVESRRKLHNEELHNLYFSPHVIKVIGPKSRNAGWKEYRGHTIERRKAYTGVHL